MNALSPQPSLMSVPKVEETLRAFARRVPCPSPSSPGAPASWGVTSPGTCSAMATVSGFCIDHQRPGTGSPRRWGRRARAARVSKWWRGTCLMLQRSSRGCRCSLLLQTLSPLPMAKKGQLLLPACVPRLPPHSPTPRAAHAKHPGRVRAGIRAGIPLRRQGSSRWLLSRF